jgi:uncharacterized membrane protein YeaQ/YmgE (transglycosylase-associated protein family)
MPNAPASAARTKIGTDAMGYLAWIVVGAVAGFLASVIMGSREGLVMMVVLGVVGGLLGGFVATNVFNAGSVDGFNTESILIATIGAIAVLFVASGMRSARNSFR